MKKIDNNVRQDQMLKWISKRKEILELIINEKQLEIKTAPKGTLRVLKRENGWQYYWRTNTVDTNGKYIPKKRHHIARGLAQRDYDKKLISLAQEELKVIELYETFIKANPITNLYNSLTPGRKALITPVMVSDEEFIEKWKSKVYEPMRIDEPSTVYYSNGGTKLRSKSEIIIANMLEKYKIPYCYEYPIMLKTMGTVRPDFTCLNIRTRQEFIWEHFGMMDNIAYANKNVAKIYAYEQNGYYQGKNMIMTFETSQHAINSYIIKTMIEQYLV